MSKLLLLPMLTLLVVAVSAPPTGAQSDPPKDPDCGANTPYDPRTNSCTEVTDQRQESSPNQAGTPSLETVPAGEAPEPSPVVQSDEDALAQDLALVAAAAGWTMEEAAADRRAADVVGRIAVQVAAARPDIFVGSALSSEPGGAPALYIKGPADQFVRNLVANAEIDIKIVENQPFSFDELGERMLQVHRALEARGFQNVSTGFSPTGGGQIRAGVTRQPGLPDDPAEILSGLPAELRASVTLTVSDAPIVSDDSAFGGMQLRDDGRNECTSGWSVWNATGTTGVTGAGPLHRYQPDR